MNSPFNHPEFLRHVNVVPYDFEADEAAERWRIEQATYAYRERCRRDRDKAVARNIWGAMGLTICMAAGIVGWCLQ